MPVLDVFMAVIHCMTVLLAEVYTRDFDKYTSRCISVGCKNAMHPIFYVYR